MTATSLNRRLDTPATIALVLRLGLAVVFITGGSWKLSRLVSPDHAGAIVGMYTAGDGYINAFFQAYLFEGVLGTVFSAWGFLTALSTFELFSGLALAIGLLVRPIALIYMFLLWTFILALPVHTVPGAAASTITYEAPAMLVQIRDIALSGLMAMLFMLGSGAWSLDQRLFGERTTARTLNWETLGLLTRLALAAPMIVGGLFAVTGAVPTFSTYPLILLVLGVMLVIGTGVRFAGAAVALIMLWQMGVAMELGASLLDNINSVKREFALLAAGIILAILGSGGRFTPSDIGRRFREYHDAWRTRAETG